MDQLAALYALYQFTDRRFRAKSLADVYDAGLDAISQVLDCKRASILIFDEHKVMRFVAWRDLSDAYRAAVDGHSPWAHDVHDPEPICIDDVERHDLPEELKEVIRRERIAALAFIPLLAGNKLVGKFMTYYERPHAFTPEETILAVTIARQLGFSIEHMRAEETRAKAEAALRHEHELLQKLIKRIPVMITLYEPDKKALRVNATFESLVGGSAQETSGTSLTDAFCLDPEYREQVTRIMDSCGDGWRDVLMRTHDGRDIQTAWANVCLSDGMQVGIGIDITERKQAEELRELMMAELNHRIKNILATVIAIADQSLTKTRSIEEGKRVFEERIQAMEKTQNRLLAASGAGISLETIVQDETAPYRSESGNLRAAGPELIVTPKCALKLGMAFHELATNAAKYGALSKRHGSVDVSWELVPNADEVHIRWTEVGGPLVSMTEHQGFGRLMLERALASELHGKVKLDFLQQGVQCFIAIPFSEHVAGAAIQQN